MKIVIIDTEHSMLPVMSPWQKGFYLSVVGMIVAESLEHEGIDGFATKEKSWVFNHKESDNKPFDKKLSQIQYELSTADLIVGQNLKHDLKILKYEGLSFNTKLHDTLVAQYLLDYQEKKHRNLKALADRYRLEDKMDEVALYWNKGIDTYDVPLYLLTEYCLHDCKLTYQIALRQRELLREEKMFKVFNLQMEFQDMLADMELNGCEFDKDKAEEIVSSYQGELLKIDAELNNLAGRKINWNSGENLSAVLYGGVLKTDHEEWRMKTFKTRPYTEYKPVIVTDVEKISGLGFKPLKNTALKKEGYFKTDKTTLLKLKTKNKTQRRVKKLILERGEISKASETLMGKNGSGLINKVQPDGRIHPHFNQAVTTTGRLSSSNPNGQNLPRGGTSPLKECIIPRNDWIMEADLSQIEWRAAAFLSQDKTMIREINSGIDQHIATCTDPDMMNLPLNKKNRTSAKIFNFRMIYKGTAYGFYMDPKMPNFSLKKYERIVDEFYQKYSGLKYWQDNRYGEANLYKVLRIPTGRKHRYTKTSFQDGIQVISERNVANYPVQGISGGDILPLAAVIIYKGMKKRGMSSIPVLTVHDSLVFDVVHDELKDLARLCKTVFSNLPQYIEQYFGFKWNVKLEGEVEFGKNYKDLKELKNIL